MKDIKELMKDQHFLAKLFVFICDIAAITYLSKITCFKCFAENMVTYGAVIGAFITSAILIVTYCQDKYNPQDLVVTQLLGTYAIMNIMAAYVYYTNIKSCRCQKYPSPYLVLSLICAATGTCMAADVGHENMK